MTRLTKMWLYMGGLCLLILLGLGVALHSQKVPQVAQQDALAVRSAQVEYLRAAQAVQDAVGPYKLAEGHLNVAMETALKNAGVDPAKYDVKEKGSDLVIMPKQEKK